MTGSTTILAKAPSALAFSAAAGDAKPAATAAKRDDTAVTTFKSAGALRKEARDATRERVKATVERLKDELKLIKAMWAGDPKALARQIARIAKELKAALADYADAARDNGDSAPAPGANVDASVPSAPDTASGDGDKTATDDPAKSASGGDAAPADPDAAKAAAAYGRTASDDTARASAVMEARGDLDFAREVHGFVQKLRDALQESKVRHAFNTTDRKGQVEAEDEAAKGLSDVDKFDTQMETDVRADFPELSVAQAPAAAAAAS